MFNDLKNEGNSFFKAGKYQEALEKYNAAIELNSNFAEAWMNKGVVHMKLEQFAESLDAFEKALEINPNYEKAKNYKIGLLEKLNQTASEKNQDNLLKEYTEGVLRKYVCKPEYLANLKTLQEKVKSAKNFNFKEQVNIVLVLIEFLLNYYKPNATQYPFIDEKLFEHTEQGRRLRLQKIANPVLLTMPEIPEIFAQKADDMSLLMLNNVQDDIFFEDTKIILRSLFELFYFFPRDERGKLIENLPWNENTWYLFDFCGAIFIEDNAIDRGNEQGGSHFTRHSFKGDRAKQKQLGFYFKSLLNHTLIVKTAILDIIQKDILKLKDFFTQLSESLNNNPVQLDDLQDDALPNLKAILWYSKHHFNIRRLLCLLPRIPAEGDFDPQMAQEMGFSEISNAEQEINFAEFLKAQKFRKGSPMLESFRGVFLEVISERNLTITIKDLIKYGYINASKFDYGIDSSQDSDKVFSTSDFITGSITPAKRWLFASATNYLNIKTLKGRLALLRKLQLIGEIFIPRNWGNKLKYVDYISADILSSIRNGLTHIEDSGQIKYIEQLEADEVTLEKEVTLGKAFRELQTLTERVYEETVKRQEHFPAWPTDLKIGTGFQSWKKFASSYWEAVKKAYLIVPAINYSNYCPGIPLVIEAEKAFVVNFAKPGKMNLINEILEGKAAFSKEKIETLITQPTSKGGKKNIKNILKRADKKYRELKNAAQTAEKDINQKENQLIEQTKRDNMAKKFPTLEQIGQEFFKDGSPPGKVATFDLLKERLKMLDLLLLESRVDTSNKGVLQEELTDLFMRDMALLLSSSYLLGQIIGILNKLYTLANLNVFPNLEKRLPEYVTLRNVLEHTDPILESFDLPYYEMLNKLPQLMPIVIAELICDFKGLLFNFDANKLTEPSMPRERLKQAEAISIEKYSSTNSSNIINYKGKEISTIYWYEDAEMNRILQYHSKRNNQLTVNGQPLYILGPLDNLSPYGLRQTLLAHNRQYGMALIPFNLGQLHWVGLMLEYNSEGSLISANYYDSQGGDAPPFLDDALKNLAHGTNHFNAIDRVQGLIQQDNNSDCGPCTIENLLAAAGHREPSATTPIVRRFNHLQALAAAGDINFYDNFYTRQRLNQSSFLKKTSQDVEFLINNTYEIHLSLQEQRELLFLVLLIMSLPANAKNALQEALKPPKKVDPAQEHLVQLTKLRNALEPYINNANAISTIEYFFCYKSGIQSLDDAALRINYNQITLLDSLLSHSEKNVETLFKESIEKDKEELDKLLFDAAYTGNTLAAKTLIQCGANINSQHTDSRNGYKLKTALFIAAEMGHKDIVNILLENGANPEIRDAGNWKPYDVALVMEHQFGRKECSACISALERS